MLCRGQRPRETVTRLPVTRLPGWQWRHSSDRSVRQSDRETHARVPRPPAVHLQLCTGPGPHLGTGAAAANRAVHAALLPWSSPHTGRSSWGPVSGPWPASPDRVGWASQLPACTHQFRCACRGAFPAPFPANGQVPSLLEARKFLSTNSQSWHDCGRGKHTPKVRSSHSLSRTIFKELRQLCEST